VFVYLFSLDNQSINQSEADKPMNQSELKQINAKGAKGGKTRKGKDEWLWLEL